MTNRIILNLNLALGYLILDICQIKFNLTQTKIKIKKEHHLQKA